MFPITSCWSRILNVQKLFSKSQNYLNRKFIVFVIIIIGFNVCRLENYFCLQYQYLVSQRLQMEKLFSNVSKVVLLIKLLPQLRNANNQNISYCSCGDARNVCFCTYRLYVQFQPHINRFVIPSNNCVSKPENRILFFLIYIVHSLCWHI